MKSIYTPFVFLLLCVLSFSIQAQDDVLPRGFAKGEKALIPAYNAWRNSRVVACESNGPASAVRTMAEWEELQGLAITWTGGNGLINILKEIVAAAKEEVQVVIICSNSAVVKNQLGASGIDWQTGITFIEDDFNSIWIRDYGPNSVYFDEVGELSLVDWIYNRPRPKDDVVPEVIADELEFHFIVPLPPLMTLFIPVVILWRMVWVLPFLLIWY